MIPAPHQPRLPVLDRLAQRASQRRADVFTALADGRWHTARELGINDRVLRLVAEQSAGEIISGQRGYKLTRHATLDEVTHAEHWLRSQATKMLRRALAIRAVRAE